MQLERAVRLLEEPRHAAPVPGEELAVERHLEPQPLAPRGERALEVGCGTGYSDAVLKEMGLKVTGLESSSALAARARKLGLDAVEGPLEDGWPKHAPYDVILIDGAIEHIPDAIIAQLSDHGRLGTALIDRGVSRLAVGRKAGASFGIHTMADSGAAALPGFSRPRVFTF